MKRLNYEAPTMEEIVVEMEQGFLAASGEQVVKTGNTEVLIERQDGYKDGDITFDNWDGQQ